MVIERLVEPRLRGLPAGFLDQPFYGWVGRLNLKTKPASAGLLIRLKLFYPSTLKRASRFAVAPRPGATSAGLVTLRESRVNAAGEKAASPHAAGTLALPFDLARYSRKYFPVYEFFAFMISSGVPVATT